LHMRVTYMYRLQVHAELYFNNLSLIHVVFAVVLLINKKTSCYN